MKIKYLYVFLLSFLLIGCNSPMMKYIKGEKNIAQTEQKIVKNENKTIESGRNYVFGADFSLSLDPNPNKYSEVAKDFTERSLLTLGNPQMQEVIELKEIVKNLLSTNQDLIIKGQKQLNEKDKEVISLQNENGKLQEKLDKQEEKLKEVNQKNAEYATTYTKIRNIIYWIIGIIAFGFVANLVSSLAPPPYNSIGAIFSLPVGLLLKFIKSLVPGASKYAGLVAQNTYNETETTLKHLIIAIEEAKRDKPDAIKEILPYLKSETSNEVSKPLITKVKQDLGYI